MTTTPREEHEYILGTDAEEIERLRFQHAAWTKEARALWERAGLRTADVVVDLGCGPGFVSLDLSLLVGPAGRVIACDRSARFLAFLESECRRNRCRNVETVAGDIEEIELPPRSVDAVYARWVLCWLADPGAALARAARWLKPGGAVLLQDYIDWGAMRLIPESAIFDRMVAACMASWEEDGEGTINVVGLVPKLAHGAGLRVEHLRPIARAGSIGSLEWRWIEEFFRTYLPKLVETGRVEAADFERWKAEFARLAAEGRAFVYAPTVADVILRKPS